jgi:hypothetical protein
MAQAATVSSLLLLDSHPTRDVGLSFPSRRRRLGSASFTLILFPHQWLPIKEQISGSDITPDSGHCVVAEQCSVSRIHRHEISFFVFPFLVFSRYSGRTETSLLLPPRDNSTWRETGGSALTIIKRTLLRAWALLSYPFIICTHSTNVKQLRRH